MCRIYRIKCIYLALLRRCHFHIVLAYRHEIVRVRCLEWPTRNSADTVVVNLHHPVPTSPLSNDSRHPRRLRPAIRLQVVACD